MCKCGKKAENFDFLVRKASAKSTPGKQYGVYQIKNPKTNKVFAFLAPVSTIEKVEGICCYTNKYGKEINLPKKKKVQEKIIVKPKTKKRTKKASDNDL